MKGGVGGGSSTSIKQERALKSKAHVQCYKCGKFGHYKRKCRSKAKQNRNVGSGLRRSMPEEKAFHVRQRRKASQATVVDSGASSHMFYDRSMFSSFVQGGPHCVITLGDGRTVSAKMTGTVFVKTRVDARTKKSLVLNDIIHVPSLDSNLVSCSALNKDGYDVSFINGKWHISQQGEAICTGVLKDGLYVLSNVAVGESAMMSSEYLNGERFWHHRFGHANVETLKAMARHDNVRGFDFRAKPEEGASCVPCTVGKQSRVSLKERSKKSFADGEVFYTGVCGPLPVQSNGGNKYFVTITDAMSSYKIVRVMKAKSDILREILSVQRQFERKYD